MLTETIFIFGFVKSFKQQRQTQDYLTIDSPMT
jgi:hypothetical protein